MAVVGRGVVRDAAHRRVHGGPAELLLGDVFAHRRLHERRAGREQRRALDHHDEVHERRRERAVPGRRPHHHCDRRHEAREMRQRLEVVRRPAPPLERVLRPLARALEQHHERDALLPGELGEALPLRGGAESDRAAHHGEVLRADEHGPAVDQAVPGDEPVGRHRRRRHPGAPTRRACRARRTCPRRAAASTRARASSRPPARCVSSRSLPPIARAASRRSCRSSSSGFPVAHPGHGLAATASAWSSTEPKTVSSTHARFR